MLESIASVIIVKDYYIFLGRAVLNCFSVQTAP